MSSAQDREIVEYAEKIYGAAFARRVDWFLAPERSSNNFVRHVRESLLREMGERNAPRR